MSRIRRLSIRGIRNFGDETEESLIRFTRPLTLILGPNGTGKTTIIESLKFATTGDFPPGGGSYFIHDPGLTRSSSVRGMVKAEIIDALGNVYTISRAVESVKTNATTRFKTLDSTLSRMTKGSKKVVSITNRCADVDTEIPITMGVTKSVLNLVIFCHQEDLNWPFEDGKKLKEKFDQIFDSARYNKAIETMTKSCKDMKSEINALKKEKNALYIIVSEVKNKEKQLEEHKRRLQSAIAKIEEVNNDLKPIHAKILDIQEKESDYKKLAAEEEKKKAEYEFSKQQLKHLKESVQEIFEGTTDDLHEQIGSYDIKLRGKSNEIKEFETRLEEIGSEESRVSRMLAEERVTIGTLKQQINDQDKKTVLRNKLMNQLLSACGLEPMGSDISEMEILAQTKRIEDKLRELEHDVEENRNTRQQEEKELQGKVDTWRVQYSKTESETNMKDEEILEVQKEIQEIKLELKQISRDANKLSSIEMKLQKAKSKIDELNNEMNVDAAKKEIQDKIKLRDEREMILNKIDEEISSLHKQSALQTEIELNKSSLLSKQTEIQKLKEKHEYTIKMLLNVKEISRTKFKTDMDKIQQELVHEIKSITQKVQDEERRLTTLETTLSHNELELLKKKQELEVNKRTISSICHYKDFDETLLLQSTKVKDLQDKRGMYAHQGDAYKQYMKQLKQVNPCCPVCHRGFTETESVKNLLIEMAKEMETHPNRLKQCETELKIEQGRYDTMLQLKPVVQRIAQLEEVDLEELNDNVEKIKKKLMQSRMSLKELENKKTDPENNLAKCKEIYPDIMLWDRYIDEISKLETTIGNLQSRMTAAGINTKRTIAEAETQREEIKMSLKNMRNSIEHLQSTVNTHTEKMQDAREECNALHEEQLKIQGDQQKCKQLKDKQETLFSREVSLQTSLRTLREQLTEAEIKLNSEMRQLEEKKKYNWDKQDKERKMVLDGTRRLSELKKIQEEVDILMYRKIPDTLKRSEEKVKRYEKLIDEFSSEARDIQKAVNESKEEIIRQEIRKRDLTDNIAIRKTENTLETLKKEYAIVKGKLTTINHKQMVEEWNTLQNREKFLQHKINIATGSKEELERIIKQCTEELKKEEYRKAHQNYNKKCIEVTVQEEVLLNLSTYVRVLDAALIEYHEERMATVNKLMKQMWKRIYTGTDTTSIEIRTNNTGGIGSAKRTYNYKLVQIKHGYEMSMKGRCSAGQKVLASIIIRLALAETFCKDCGIIALDEPTTNLDEENSNNLAAALAIIVKLRSQYQKNFQLIVISHDEKFLLKLANLNNNRGFYELYRKPNGYSAVKYYEVENRSNFSLDVKEEISSDEETTEQPENSRDKQRTLISSHGSKPNEDSSQNKRHARNESDEDRYEKPRKRRFALHNDF